MPCRIEPMSWDITTPRWDTPAGSQIDRFLAACRAAPELNNPASEEKVTIFGSAAIQLRLDGGFMSADADLLVLSQKSRWELVAHRIGLGQPRGKASQQFYIQVCGPAAFRSTSIWMDRATSEARHGFTVRIPSLRDILIGKLHRHRPPERDCMEPKDRHAFERIFQLTGGRPMEAELLEDLRLCPHAWHLEHGDHISDLRLNAEEIWPILYGHPLNVNAHIISPLLVELEDLGYRGTRDWISLTRALRPLR
jgi:hypothetical protein